MTFPAVPRDVTVELEINSVWVDVSTDVRQTDPVTIKRGIGGEGSRVQPGQCRLTLDDTSGDYNPLNPTGAHYSLLGRNTPLRVTVDTDVRFYGEVAKLTPQWTLDHADRIVLVEAAGILRRLEQSVSPLQSAFRRFLASQDPFVYWPCEDGKDSAAPSSAVEGVGPLTVAEGTVDMAAYTGWVASEPLMQVKSAAILKATLPPYSHSGVLRTVAFFAVPEDGPPVDNATLLLINTEGSVNQWLLQAFTDGHLELFGIDLGSGGSTLVYSSGALGFDLRGQNAVVDLLLDQNGANVDWTLSVWDDVTSGGVISSTAPGQTLGRAHTIQIGLGTTGLNGTAVGHIGMFNTATLGNIVGAARAHSGETAVTRMNRLAGEENIPLSVLSGQVTSAQVGAQTTGTVLELIREAADADMGTLFEARDVLSLVYRPRSNAYNQAADLTLDYAAGQVAPVLQPVSDDKATRNDVTVTRSRGGQARAIQQTGPLNVQPPGTDPDAVGRYQHAVTLNLAVDNQLRDAAAWLRHLGTVDEPRYPTVRVDLAAAGVATDPVVAADALDIDVGDRLIITNLDDAHIYEPVTQIALGYTEKITTAYQHDIAFNCAPESPYHVPVLDAASARLGSGTCTLAEDLQIGETGMGVATSGALWTTDPAQFPFDLMVGGERMTATAVTGTSSPQIVTVTRAVNGVVKEHLFGVAVRLADPHYLAL